MALTRSGFKRERFEDVFARMEDKAREVFGDTVNTNARSVLGIILRIVAWILAMLWQDTEDVYNSGYVNTSEGVNLDRLGPYVGISRIGDQYAVGAVVLTGTPGYIVQAGFRVAAGDRYFETDADAIISADGSVKTTITAVEPGQAGNVAAGKIVDIVNPNADVIAATNPEATSGGREKEIDTEFRERFTLSVSGGGAGTVDSIRGALLSVPGVRAAVVIENTANATDNAGRPPKSFESYVLGGHPKDIGAAIFSKKSAGIESYGTESVTVTDLAGYPHTVRFSYALTVSVSLQVTIKKTSSYPIDGSKLTKTALVKYIGGEDADGQLYAGLTMGASVVHARLLAAALTVEGVDDVQIELSTDGGATWSEDNVLIVQQNVAQTSAAQIEVVEA
ncbi:baseplate J/gp47 family protein [Paenibacillus spongiae]|uniref:Baseplate J/gp47 family protein n=1 Tax=Paenibacillus spongiae TaxID=2909671 RepID=A0ABY5S3A2_9BACL|nr:baseplate J/gp47 family protein [Paenibacillus spongiae]UVI28159.1 baseplate J/gp47 family protein [Paenibacillus spongiae]